MNPVITSFSTGGTLGWEGGFLHNHNNPYRCWVGSYGFDSICISYADLWCFHTRARQRQDNDKTNVEPVHFYDVFHTWFVGPGMKLENPKCHACTTFSCFGKKIKYHFQVSYGT